ncbi:MAG: 30S ribosomal protein S27e [Euryarchaeota archaeon]|nr:30S ribosomal protein S27e [Euryarchaeota archaeon]
MPRPRSRFLRVKCLDCGNEQVMFGSASMNVKCAVCGKTLAKCGGGKATILTKIVAVLE